MTDSKEAIVAEMRTEAEREMIARVERAMQDARFNLEGNPIPQEIAFVCAIARRFDHLSRVASAQTQEAVSEEMVERALVAGFAAHLNDYPMGGETWAGYCKDADPENIEAWRIWARQALTAALAQQK